MATPEATSPQPAEGQLGRLCFRCHKANQRGSVALCLLVLHKGSVCPRRAFLQRHQPDTLHPTVTPSAPVAANPVLPTQHVVPPSPTAVPTIMALRARYGDALGRWHGLFARLAPPPPPQEP